MSLALLASTLAGVIRSAIVEASLAGLASVAAPKRIDFQQATEGTMLQFLASWPVLLGAAIILMALALLIEPAVPARSDGQLTEVAELNF
jgi:hypothetical protein